MLNFWSIVAAILKMATGRNFSMSGINSENSTLSNFNDISCVDRLLCPELIPDIEKFLPVAIFKMAATVPYLYGTYITHLVINYIYYLLYNFYIQGAPMIVW
jgi:hypothetical protein